MVPRKCHIGHADEIPVTQITDIADRDVAAVVVEALSRVWVPQRNSIISSREFLLVNVERLIY
jgi:hypothetical protein